MYSNGEILDQVAVLSQHVGDENYRAKIQTWVNLGQDFAFNAYDFWSELQAIYAFSSVSGTEKYYMPSNFDKPTRLFDYTNNNKLSWITRESYVDANIASVSGGVTGQPQYCSLYGISAVAYENASSFTVQVKSSSTSDNGGITVRIEGWLDSAKTILGHEDIVISTSSPTTYVAGVNTYYGLTRCVKSDDTVGFVTIADSTPTVLATISPYDRQSRYPVLWLGLIPNATISYKTYYKQRIQRMVDNNDYPFANIDDYLICYATGFAYQEEKESQSRAESMWKKADDFLMTAIRNEQAKMGTDYQQKFVPSTSQAHRH